MQLVEPLRLLFKDEVRRVGEELGMPERLVWRQPFPGPGLAVRIVGAVTRERVEILQQADTRERFLRQGADAVITTPEEFQRLMQSEFAKYQKLVKDAGISTQ